MALTCKIWTYFQYIYAVVSLLFYRKRRFLRTKNKQLKDNAKLEASWIDYYTETIFNNGDYWNSWGSGWGSHAIYRSNVKSYPHFNSLRLTKSITPIFMGGDVFHYSGALKGTTKGFKRGYFSVDFIDFSKKNAVFLFCLRGLSEPNEVTFEMPNNSFVKVFGVTYVKVYVTIHTGTHYKYDHNVRRKPVWLPVVKNRERFTHRALIIRDNGFIYWLIDGVLVWSIKDPFNTSMMVVMGYVPGINFNENHSEVRITDLSVYSYDD